MDGERVRVGLCAECTWVRRVVSARGSVFWMCERALADGRYRKYPALPVVECPGFELVDERIVGDSCEIDEMR